MILKITKTHILIAVAVVLILSILIIARRCWKLYRHPYDNYIIDNFEATVGNVLDNTTVVDTTTNTYDGINLNINSVYDKIISRKMTTDLNNIIPTPILTMLYNSGALNPIKLKLKNLYDNFTKNITDAEITSIIRYINMFYDLVVWDLITMSGTDINIFKVAAPTTSTQAATTSTQSATTSTQGATTSTQAATTSTQAATTSTQAATTSTQGATTSTQGATTSTQAATTSTQAATTSTQAATTSTQAATTSTQAATYVPVSESKSAPAVVEAGATYAPVSASQSAPVVAEAGAAYLSALTPASAPVSAPAAAGYTASALMSVPGAADAYSPSPASSTTYGSYPNVASAISIPEIVASTPDTIDTDTDTPGSASNFTDIIPPLLVNFIELTLAGKIKYLCTEELFGTNLNNIDDKIINDNIYDIFALLYRIKNMLPSNEVGVGEYYSRMDYIDINKLIKSLLVDINNYESKNPTSTSSNNANNPTSTSSNNANNAKNPYGNITQISDDGISAMVKSWTGSNKYSSPLTNIMQSNYVGSTNVYSPLIDLNKNTGEKFVDADGNIPADNYYYL